MSKSYFLAILIVILPFLARADEATTRLEFTADEIGGFLADDSECAIERSRGFGIFGAGPIIYEISCGRPKVKRGNKPLTSVFRGQVVCPDRLPEDKRDAESRLRDIESWSSVIVDGKQYDHIRTITRTNQPNIYVECENNEITSLVKISELHALVKQKVDEQYELRAKEHQAQLAAQMAEAQLREAARVDQLRKKKFSSSKAKLQASYNSNGFLFVTSTDKEDFLLERVVMNGKSENPNCVYSRLTELTMGDRVQIPVGYNCGAVLIQVEVATNRGTFVLNFK